VYFHSLLGVKEKLIREDTGEFGVFFSQTSQKLFIFCDFLCKKPQTPLLFIKMATHFFCFFYAAIPIGFWS
jgi:hypothetical protein